MNQEFIYKLAEKLQKVGTIHAIGETWISFDSSIPAGGVPFCGQLVSRAAWADLFAWATAQGKVKTETEWQAHASANGGNCPYYSSGDGSTNFRMPKIVGYMKGTNSEHVTPETYNVIVGVYAVGIVTRTGSTDLDAVLTGIAQAEETANNVSNELANNLGNLAKLQSFFNGTVAKTLLAGGTANSDWIGNGAITLSESWKNFDALLAFMTNDSSTSLMNVDVIWKWQLEWLLEMCTSSSKNFFTPWLTLSNNHFSFKVSQTTEIVLASPDENSGIQAIYGLKLQGTGVTNASAIDVSHVQSRLAGMLTDDNHLILPSGLEVW